MSGVGSLVDMHRKDMASLRSESRKALKDRVDSVREMDRAYRELREKLAAEMPSSSSFSEKLRTPVVFVVTLMGVLSF